LPPGAVSQLRTMTNNHGVSWVLKRNAEYGGVSGR
jgi:hypothetical protein